MTRILRITPGVGTWRACPRQESNLGPSFRKRVLYPLSHVGSRCHKRLRESEGAPHRRVGGAPVVRFADSERDLDCHLGSQFTPNQKKEPFAFDTPSLPLFLRPYLGPVIVEGFLPIHERL